MSRERLIPALFPAENAALSVDAPDPMLDAPTVSAYWRAFQQNAQARQALAERYRGL